MSEDEDKDASTSLNNVTLPYITCVTCHGETRKAFINKSRLKELSL